MRNYLLIVLFSIGLVSCASHNPPELDNNPLTIASRVTVLRDEFKKKTTFVGPAATTISYDYPYKKSETFIRVIKLDGYNTIIYQIYISDKYTSSGWHFYDEVYDSNGNHLPTTIIRRDVLGCEHGECLYIEEIGATVTPEYMQRAKTTGIEFQVSGKSPAKLIMLIPAGYVKGILDSVRQ